MSGAPEPPAEATVDVVVLGAGPAGEVAAGGLAQRGHAVTLVEADLVGGECAYYACMPSKALLRPAQALAEARRVPGAQSAGEALDVAAVLARRDEVVSHLDDAHQLPWLEDRGIELIRGHGRLDGPRRVRIGERLRLARQAVIVAVGSVASLPPIPGLAEAAPWTNREITLARRVPERLIVLGGGPAGVEMADAFTSLGAHVVLIEAQERLLAREEPYASEELRAALADRGVEIHLATGVERVEREPGIVRARLADGRTVAAEEIFVGTGRRPSTDDLGLDTVGLAAGGFIEVDDSLRVPGLPWLYAIGDVNGRSLQTHVGKRQAAIVADILDGRDPGAGAETVTPPRVIFTEPQVAAVGMTLADARAGGADAHAYDVASSATAGASFHGRGTPGTSRIVVDEARGVLLGATFVGSDVAEWLHAATIAIVGAVPVERLREAIPAFPTRSEVWLKLLEERDARRAR